MTERRLSKTDTALRDRITEPCVHIPRGEIRGPVRRRAAGQPYRGERWQSCPGEDSPEMWPGCDVSRERDLCIVCFRGTAGGTSRWSWLACQDCRTVNSVFESPWRVTGFALARHSLMNGIGMRDGIPPDVGKAQIARLLPFADGSDRLRDWPGQEYPRLASRFDPLSDVPLRVWQ